jgi:hypothetical protein
VGFHIYISPVNEAYLANLPLSGTGKSIVERFILEGIANLPDSFRLDPVRRLSGATRFSIDHVFLDGDEGHRIEFIVNDSTASMGVLSIDYVEHHPHGPW